MDPILFIVTGAMVLFCVGVLAGLGLQTRSIDRQYRRLAKLVRYVNESDAVMDGNPAKYRASPANNQAAAWRSIRAEESMGLPPEDLGQRTSGAAPIRTSTSPRFSGVR